MFRSVVGTTVAVEEIVEPDLRFRRAWLRVSHFGLAKAQANTARPDTSTSNSHQREVQLNTQVLLSELAASKYLSGSSALKARLLFTTSGMNWPLALDTSSEKSRGRAGSSPAGEMTRNTRHCASFSSSGRFSVVSRSRSRISSGSLFWFSVNRSGTLPRWKSSLTMP